MPKGPVHRPTRYLVVPDKSAVLIEARSNAGPISFGSTTIAGFLVARQAQGSFVSHPVPEAELSLDLRSLRSGNKLYDAELARRLDSRRFPQSTIILRDMRKVSGHDRYRVTGEVTLHGVTRGVDGSVSATVNDDGTCEVTGEQTFDIRDFDIPTPSVLMLRIFPDVRVHLKLELGPPESSPGAN